MITQIEQALVERLQRGLGQLATTVKSYGGELDEMRFGTTRLPAVLVTFGGSQVSQMNVQRKRFQSKATFVVMVVVRSLRSEQAGRVGGVAKMEIGANQLLTAVRRLLDGQSLNGLVRALIPKRVRTIYNNALVQNERFTAYAVEFEAVFDDVAPLADGRFPEPTEDKNHPDYMFNHYQGELSAPYPDLERISVQAQETENQVSSEGLVELTEKEHNHAKS